MFNQGDIGGSNSDPHRLESSKMPYNGEERRAEYCPVHNIKCDEIKSIENDTKSRVPIWVFTIFVTAMLIALGWINLQSKIENKKTMEMLEKHLMQSNLMFEKTGNVLSRATHSLNEVALNQQTVMKKLQLDFQKIPNYSENQGDKYRK